MITIFLCGFFSLFVFHYVSFCVACVSFLHWTNFRSNPINADVLYLSDKKRFESSHFNQSNALIIYLHGFSERVPGGAGQSSQEIRDGMCTKSKTNIGNLIDIHMKWQKKMTKENGKPFPISIKPDSLYLLSMSKRHCTNQTKRN